MSSAEAPTECECGECGDVDPETARQDILHALEHFIDPVEAELFGGMLLATTRLAGDDLEETGITPMLPALLALGENASAVLAVLASLGTGRLGQEAAAELDRLPTRGSAPWIEELAQPVTARDFLAMTESDDETFVLSACFDRADRSHAIILLVEPDHCGAAASINLIDSHHLPAALDEVRQHACEAGLTFHETPLSPAEFRWRAEVALDRRATHDREDLDTADLADIIDLGDEDGPGYHIVLPLLQARLRTLPKSPKPIPAHPQSSPDDLLDMLRQFTTAAGRPLGSPRPRKLPAKRKTRDGRAPIYRLRVDLRGAKPPIWRRLEVPGDIPLNELHDVLQVAFEWDDDHLHVFETDFGDFGEPDPELGRRAETKATLEQVASGGAKLVYTYDFGDDWEHTILVEHIGPAEATAEYPRCTGGRRAAPPEDCGGIWGYENLLATLADPSGQEHEDLLEWLGLDAADDFDPAQFDKNAINSALARMRGARNTRKRR
ncbi:plasmid pRiA4b ORF-3 family protein [Nocardia sp. NPDC051981]|uniref:plasmid pRiA4b ORF-3 family protein n=1 Tax=Nocardia sp. NPDC051981 TaxID=3155417 RepID=UPI003443ED90